MDSLLQEIRKIRHNRPFVLDRKNSNRYRISLIEQDDSKTDYYFSAPIYNSVTRKALDFKFCKKDGYAYYNGSDCDIKFSNNITMKNKEGTCKILTDKNITFASENELRFGKNFIYPTTNGLMFKIDISQEQPLVFDLETDRPLMQVKWNEKYFSFMSEKFKPFMTVSSIGVSNIYGEIFAPLKIAYQKINDKRYRLIFTHNHNLGRWILFEVNFYEPKLIQDTTVESANIKSNNAFGGTAFIGNTSEFGDQWLYSRLDVSKMEDFSDKKIIKAVAHLPKYNSQNVPFSVFKTITRFCSFGSTWESKVAASNLVANSTTDNNYQNIDVTDLISDSNGRFIKNDGIIIKSKNKGGSFSVIATGDSCYAPQIYEINYK